MKIYIIDGNNLNSENNNKEIKKYVKKVLKKLELHNDTEICISFIDDESMRHLNATYRNIDKTTDVLSFAQDGHNLGDVVISFETARRNAARYKTSLKNEIRRLVVHGILHLLGYNHKKKKEREIMRNKEKELIAYIKSL